MRVILGIGNPGAEYDGTRHNLGFMVVDLLATRLAAGRWARKWNALVAEAAGPAGKLLLVKPTTYVNSSGEAAQALLAFHKLTPAELLVVVDDLHLALGDIRVRGEGSAGGHNGLRDIEARLGRAYPRLRLGMGPLPPGVDQVGFVLGRFAPDQREDAAALVAKAAAAAEAWLAEGIDGAMRFNGPLRPPPPKPRPPAPQRLDTSSVTTSTPKQDTSENSGNCSGTGRL
ncbi:MAG: aminoacyl-tRNA hydrolase [Planctomycetes bacterium]|nr:aminoacyl-tRNA hydrolase [Planctomycetota bacterium]